MTQATWIPAPGPDSQPFFDGAAAGKLRLQVCDSCGTWTFPVARICANCGSNNIVWRDASGKGRVYAHGRLARAYHPRHAERLPLVLAQVDLAEGVRLHTNIIDVTPDQLRVGGTVEVTFEHFADGGVLPVFRPAD
ncbi:MAG: OB-fold domain-containing protein [Pseudomonadota bacterium]